MFDAGEQHILISYLQFTIISGWGGILAGMGNRRRLFISHDSWFSMRGLEEMPDVIEALRRYGLPTQGAP